MLLIKTHMHISAYICTYLHIFLHTTIPAFPLFLNSEIFTGEKQEDEPIKKKENLPFKFMIIED